MDGFAVRAADVSPGAELRVIGDLAAGGSTLTVAPGTAARISTGAAIPRARTRSCASRTPRCATAVVVARRRGPSRPARAPPRRGPARRRRARAAGRRPDRSRACPRWPRRASASVAVHRRPRLDLFVTGNELLPPGAPPEPGKIYESNGLTVGLLAEAAGATVVRHPAVADDFEATREAVERGLEGDILVVSGGVSVGPHDHVKPAFEACGVDEVFWRVRIKPGKPLWFGRRGSTLVFGLPGNPLSAIVGMALFVVPALRRLSGESDRRPALRARPPRRARRPVRRPHDVPDLQARPGPKTACWSRIRPSARART